MPPIHTFERRRHGFVPRVARLTFPVRRAADDFVAGFPCSFIGHRWVEVPRRRGQPGPRIIRFACGRCSQPADFTV